MICKNWKWPKWVAALGAMAMALGLLASLAAAGPPAEPPGNGPPDIIPLGKALDHGRLVEGYAIIHYEKGYARPPGRGRGGGEKCFAFLARGARWRTTEQYVVNPTNSRGMDETTVRALTSTSLETWDTEVDFEIFGTEDAAATVDGIDLESPDNKNEVLFGDYPQDGVIAVTVVWGIFTGPPFARELVEWDALFDEADFDWSAEETGAAGKMDFQNIATHEFGHAAGLGHPDDSCTEETMYRFADFGETKKRDLHTGDIAGINELY